MEERKDTITPTPEVNAHPSHERHELTVAVLHQRGPLAHCILGVTSVMRDSRGVRFSFRLLPCKRVARKGVPSNCTTSVIEQVEMTPRVLPKKRIFAFRDDDGQPPITCAWLERTVWSRAHREPEALLELSSANGVREQRRAVCEREWT